MTRSEKVVDGLMEMFKGSIIVQSLMTGAVVVTVCAMIWTQRDIPKEFLFLVGTITGFWFNVKKEFELRSMVKQQSEATTALVHQVQSMMMREAGRIPLEEEKNRS